MDVRGLLTEGFGRITELYDDIAERTEWVTYDLLV